MVLRITLCAGIIFGLVHADIPTAEIVVTIKNDNNDNPLTTTLYATQASFGTYPPEQKNVVLKKQNYPYSFTPVLAPDFDPILCNTDEEMANIDPNNIPVYDPSVVMLIPRGKCTFEQKALNAQNRYNVGGIIIYGSLSSRYGYNVTTQSVIYPRDKYDYDCSFGQGTIPSNQLTFDPIYEPSNDAILNNQCENTENDKIQCASHKCLITGPPSSSGTSQICCAWDLHIWLYNDYTIPSNTTETTVRIPAVYITMNEFDKLSDIMANTQNNIQLSLFARNRPSYNISGLLVWALGVLTAALAAYLSASDIRNKLKRVNSRALIDNAEQQSRQQQGQEQVIVGSRNVRSRSPISSSQQEAVLAPPTSLEQGPQQQQEHGHDDDDYDDDETLELTLAHALFFLVWSSLSLFILFYFEIYSVVKVFYAFGCASAFSQVIVTPLFRLLSFGKMNVDRIFFTTKILDIGPVSYLDFSSIMTGYALGLVWLVISFTQHNADQIAFYWIMQDLMGMSICIVFLSILKVNTLKIASTLLVAAFFYDIFFVFLTPFFFSGKSIMVTVATSGGPPTADALWCEKYPSDKDCQGGDPLPMLLTIPRLGDYQGGASLLGLGDIVLPGLVLSFASRLDVSKRLVASMNESGGIWLRDGEGRRGFILKEMFSGYFGPIVVAYAIGLLMANAAVYLMQMGQPALLYLVPMCLGSLFFVGWRKGEVDELWNGPKILKTVERIVKNSSRSDEGNDNISLTRISSDSENERESNRMV